MSKQPTRAARRSFMRSAAAAAATGVAAPMALNLAATGQAAAATAQDYKALVCVFLYGGNDNYNTVVPYDLASYNEYARMRGSLALGHGSLASHVLNPDNGLDGGRQFALALQLTGLHEIWTEGNMGVLMNVGPLVVPTSKADYASSRVPLPPKLFSHNDQQSVWQSLAAEGATTGWGGRMADLFADANQNQIFTSMSLNGNAVMLSGEHTVQYQMSPSGPVTLNGQRYDVYRHPAVSQMIEQLVTTNVTGHQMSEIYSEVARRSIAANDVLTGAMASVDSFTTAQHTSELGEQLSRVATVIAARNQLGMKRQVFFVGLGGFDHHDGLAANHPVLMKTLDDALSSFYRTTQELGVADNVTTFTASDFGRTLSGNGDGTDHGWGGHHFMIGGAVKGRSIYGQVPELGDDGPDDVGRGRLLPSTSVEQMSATLGSWFGVSNTELDDIFPRLSEFSERDLGMFNT